MSMIDDSSSALEASQVELRRRRSSLRGLSETVEQSGDLVGHLGEAVTEMLSDIGGAITTLEELQGATASLGFSSNTEALNRSVELVTEASGILGGANGRVEALFTKFGQMQRDIDETLAVLYGAEQQLDQGKKRLDTLRTAPSGSAAGAAASGSGTTGPTEWSQGGKSAPKPSKSHGTQQKRAGIMEGPVRFSAPRSLAGKVTADHRLQAVEYIDAANQALEDGKLSSVGRVRPSKNAALKNAKEAAARQERDRAEAAGKPYGDKVAAHLPDTTWAGTASPPGGWGRHDDVINSSLGSQSDKYPENYKPKKFELDETWDDTGGETGETSSVLCLCTRKGQ